MLFDIFQSISLHPSSQRQPPEFDYVKRIYLRELLGLQEYYHNRVYAVRNQNLLVRLLAHVDTPMDYTADRYVEVTRIRAPYIVKAFKLTSEIDYGVVHAGVFYGPGTDEVLLYDDTYFDPIYAERNWKRITAVTPIWHPRSDMGFMLPNGRATSTDTGLAVTGINLPMLALQYRCFLREQMIKQQHGDGLLGASHFIHMYVLPNMMYAHTDIIVMNRLMRIYYDLPMGMAKHKHPFPIVSYENKLDSVLKKIITDYKNIPMQYDWLLSAMPAISNIDMAHAMLIPEIAPTRQIWWAMMISRLETISFLIDLGGEESIRRNGIHLNRLNRDLRRLKRENIYDQVLPYETSRPIHLLTNKLIELTS